MPSYQTCDLGASMAAASGRRLARRDLFGYSAADLHWSSWMRAVVVALGLAALSLPALALAQAQPAEPAQPAPQAAPSARERMEADKLRPGRGQLESYVGEKKGSGVGGDDKRKWESTRDKIDAALAQGDCAGARKIATNEGLHDLAAQIRRACKKS
ncbi:hypothetical protein [Phenylobacterium sp.]|jgi:hypothetical protein|uniref:hypothetical protein n=1 Tax=Phenylobacterium sp. TaxID=1871053 RepID=UPI002F91F6E9